MDFLWFLSQFRTPLTTGLSQVVTLFGQQTLLIVLICICFWCFNKDMAVQAGFSFCFSGTLVQGLKLCFRIPRPWVLDPDFQPVKSAVAAATGYSFPSGHTQSATAIYGTVGYKTKRKWLRVICFLAVLLIGFSRLFLGVHTPKDVLGALLIAAGSILLVDLLLKKSSKKGQRWPVLLLSVVSVFAFALLIYGYVLYRLGIVKLSYALDCAENTGASLGFVAGYILEKKFVGFDPKQKIYIQVIKSVVGLVLLVVLQKLLGFVCGASMPGIACQNFFLILFIVFGYPFCFHKILK